MDLENELLSHISCQMQMLILHLIMEPESIAGLDTEKTRCWGNFRQTQAQYIKKRFLSMSLMSCRARQLWHESNDVHLIKTLWYVINSIRSLTLAVGTICYFSISLSAWVSFKVSLVNSFFWQLACNKCNNWRLNNDFFPNLHKQVREIGKFRRSALNCWASVSLVFIPLEGATTCSLSIHASEHKSSPASACPNAVVTLIVKAYHRRTLLLGQTWDTQLHELRC
jgi:hypothetical protein